MNMVMRFISSLLPLIFFSFLYLQIFYGLDLTDESQHYLQIKSLIENSDLFQNDLFYQQVVYLLFYPAIKLIVYLQGYDSFLINLRLLLSFLYLISFILIFKSFLNYGVGKSSAILLSTSIVMISVGIGNVSPFSINYNTISYLFTSIFLTQYICWNKNERNLILIWPIFTIFSNPFVSLGMFLSIWWKNFSLNKQKFLTKILIFHSLGILISYILILRFSSYETLIDSISFSKEFSVGNALFNSSNQIFVSIVFLILFIFFKKFQSLITFKKTFIIFSFTLFAFSITFFELFNEFEFKLIRTTLLLILIFFINLILLNHKEKSSIHLDSMDLNKVFLLLCFMFVISSSNGLNQAFVPLLMALPLYFFILIKNKGSFLSSFDINVAKLILYSLPFLILFNSLLDGYRENGRFFLTDKITEVKEFNNIFTTSEKKKFIINTKLNLPNFRGEKTLIEGNLPGIYFITGTTPETCMVFLRNLNKTMKIEVFEKCMKNKDPSIFLSFSPSNTKMNLSSKYLLKEFPICEDTIEIKHPLKKEDYNFKLCKKS